jgi:NitT/TauT family transport system permease protein
MRRLVNFEPRRRTAFVLTTLPFALLLAAYAFGSFTRLAANPNDKLLPSFHTLAHTIWQYAFEEDRRSGGILLWVDTAASLVRLGIALGISALLGLMGGVLIGSLPVIRSVFGLFVAAIAMIPPLAILPILFIVLGLDEPAKIALIVIGITPVLIRDLAQRAQELPQEQLVKAQTLGASSWQLILRVILPQVTPRLFDAVRLNLCSAWLFLIAAEAIASTEGLGYRIFLVRRYLAMDVILPYVVWITLLAVAMDFALRVARRRLFPWSTASA